MAEIVNLRRARKARDRATAKVAADANAAKHGADKTTKAQAKAAAEALRRALDGAKRERDDD